MSERKLTAAPFHCEPRALIHAGNAIIFGGTHPEGFPVPLFGYDLTVNRIWHADFPAGILAMASDDKALYLAGTDRRLYKVDLKEFLKNGKSPKPLGDAQEKDLVGIASAAGDNLAALCGNNLVILSKKNGKESLRFELPEEGTALAANQAGDLLAAGCKNGTVAVFSREQNAEFAQGESAALHRGAVTALLFEPGEPRLYSAGADGVLNHTHVRGALEPERRDSEHSGHKKPIEALFSMGGKRFYSVSADAAVKSWEIGLTRKQPVTLKDAGKGLALGRIQYHERAILVMACIDNTLRFVDLDQTEAATRVRMVMEDAYSYHRLTLREQNQGERENAVRDLAALADKRAIEVLNAHLRIERDTGLKELACQLMGETKHPLATQYLERLLNDRSGVVRLKALQCLIDGGDRLRAVTLALKTGKADVGTAAIDRLEAMSREGERAFQLLTDALQHQAAEVRLAALESLGKVLPADTPEAEMTGLGSKWPDVRIRSLLRCLQRNFLSKPTVQAALRRHIDDQDADVRRIAFLLTLKAKPALTDTLRFREPELHRSLYELEHPQKKDGKLPKAKKPKTKPTEEDLGPLLEAMAGREGDNCLRGAMGLARLGDTRAFGSLLQLSRDSDDDTRYQVCAGFGELGDINAVQRLGTLLFDKVAGVRDAAFSALIKLHGKNVIAVVETGLSAEDPQIRIRALNLLVDRFKQGKPPESGRRLLLRFLGDNDLVATNAFKATLTLNIDGSQQAALAFCLQSSAAHLRGRVQREIIAELKQPWAFPMLLARFQDPDPSLRVEAFQTAMREKPKRRSETIGAACACSYADLRREAVTWLKDHVGETTQALLLRLLDDPDKTVRLQAVDALVLAQAREELRRALEVPRQDVALEAAVALAAYGDDEALAPLMKAAAEDEPEEGDKKTWLDRVNRAVEGLGELQAAEARDLVANLLDSKHESLRRTAIDALVTICDQQNLEPLHHALRHPDPRVADRAAYYLAVHGDPAGAERVFGKSKEPDLLPAAALGLEDKGEYLTHLLDHAREEVRVRTMKLMLVLEQWRGHGSAGRLLAMLSCASPGARLEGAEALECVGDKQRFAELVHRALVRLDRDRQLNLEPEVTEAFGRVLALGEPRLRYRAVKSLLPLLEEVKPTRFKLRWQLFNTRFAEQLSRLDAKPKQVTMTADKIRRLVFGAYVGLARLEADRGAPNIRRTALKRLCRMAEVDHGLTPSVRATLLPALRDSHDMVRNEAFDSLLALKHDPSDLATEALASGYNDMGARGLELLAEAADDRAIRETLAMVQSTFTNGMEFVATNLRLKSEDNSIVFMEGLSARSKDLREHCMTQLGPLYGRGDNRAAEVIHDALESKYLHVRVQAMQILSKARDGACFQPLLKLLDSVDQKDQRDAVRALIDLGDPRTPAALLDRLDNDPTNSAEPGRLIIAAGNFRDSVLTPRLLRYLDNSKLRNHAVNALVTISGYDQRLVNPFEEDGLPPEEPPDHPHHDAVLRDLLQTLVLLQGSGATIDRLIDMARWSKSDLLNEILSQLTQNPKTAEQALAAIAWRVRRRHGPVQPLLDALGSGEIMQRFIAAEGLANAGRAEGFTILETCLEMLPELNYRIRAVRALGRLGDKRALKILLDQAQAGPGHALREEAIEALGHMAHTEEAPNIFKLLERMLRDSNAGVKYKALRGLAWFGSAEAWALIRETAGGDDDAALEAVIRLRDNDEPATRDLLLDLLGKAPAHLLDSVRETAAILFGEDDMEPVYALMSNPDFYADEKDLARIREQARPDRLFSIIPRVEDDDLRVILTNILLAAKPLPVKKAVAACGDPEPVTAALAARVLGRAGDKVKAHAGTMESTVRHSWTQWQDLATRQSFDLDDWTDCLRYQIWACGRLQCGVSLLTEILDDDHDEARALREEATAALAACRAAQHLETLLPTAEPVVRDLAASALDNPQTDAVDMIGRRRLGKQAPPLDELITAARHADTQGTALEHLIRGRHIAPLQQLANDADLTEATRLGAMDALAVVGGSEAEDALRAVAMAEKESEDLARAAWRVLRRAKRLHARKREKAS
ncbi:MAG: HEAT repeat domain-containing protein [Acidobacteriota bacterium]|nr:HEAT repeat domain-containing protein [Acidobacteriota bacterium]